jgi:glycosyltransferase involved in cell wall biosynthesis
MRGKAKLLYLVTEDWYFWSHRLPLARAARDKGYDVVIATRVDECRERIESEGFRLIDIRLRRRSRNPVQEILAIAELVGIYRRERPDLVHHVAVKPVLYGSLAARWTGVPRVLNALAGMGYLFTSSHRRARLLQSMLEPAFKAALAMPGSRVILQNPDDARLLVERELIRREQVALIRGSGVDTRHFSPRPEQEGSPLVVLASRMLWDKGVKEFVEAARILREEGTAARFALVGDGDPDNPASIPASTMKDWDRRGDVEWWGFRGDMPYVFQQAHIVILPSYREGLPKVLLEAAACGRPIVATDTPGCREIVRDGVNGFLVPVRDSLSLARSVKRLIDSKELRQQMGGEGRRMVLDDFSQESVVRQTMDLYGEAVQ